MGCQPGAPQSGRRWPSARTGSSWSPSDRSAEVNRSSAAPARAASGMPDGSSPRWWAQTRPGSACQPPTVRRWTAAMSQHDDRRAPCRRSAVESCRDHTTHRGWVCWSNERRASIGSDVDDGAMWTEPPGPTRASPPSGEVATATGSPRSRPSGAIAATRSPTSVSTRAPCHPPGADAAHGRGHVLASVHPGRDLRHSSNSRRRTAHRRRPGRPPSTRWTRRSFERFRCALAVSVSWSRS